MEEIRIFDENVEHYDRWFQENSGTYQAELEALRRVVSTEGRAIEIGAGTGRFSSQLGIRFGVEPAGRMAKSAKARGLAAVQALGEYLPFKDRSFDLALLVTVLCFVADPAKLLRETARVLAPQGRLVIGYIDRATPLGGLYESKKGSSLFYRSARFRTAQETEDLVVEAGYAIVGSWQTLLDAGSTEGDRTVKEGRGEGGFVALAATLRS
ncbi:MAG TPA: class I SAM-dependent methyltransferase [Planctomycetota bacterium]|nr:class I SAM-dependent methyltransferase [Planctomycetota bacterium]